MRTLGATLTRFEPGVAVIEMAYSESLTQQHGFLHAGAVTSVLDSACGYAAFSLMPAGSGVLSIEFKTNLLAPARGDRLVASARVVRPGRTITVCQAEAVMYEGDRSTLIATMLATMMCIQERPGVVG
jgi:uncharacterized protein (TIGR00369 family)